MQQPTHMWVLYAQYLLIALRSVSEENPLSLHVDVHLALEGRHVTLDDVLHLVRQLGLHLLLEASEEKGAEHFVEAANDQDCLLFV